MHTKSERVNLALEKLREIKKEVKCSEDFVENRNYPIFNLVNIKELSQRPDFFKILQIFMLNTASRVFANWVAKKTVHLFDQPQYLAVAVSAILQTQYGECNELSDFLMLKLMQANKFPPNFTLSNSCRTRY